MSKYIDTVHLFYDVNRLYELQVFRDEDPNKPVNSGRCTSVNVLDIATRLIEYHKDCLRFNSEIAENNRLNAAKDTYLPEMRAWKLETQFAGWPIPARERQLFDGIIGMHNHIANETISPSAKS